MFSWNFAKSAEAVFTRWAVKRVCKFVLKKKLGQFILGEIDLDQLDVQLREGTIQLNDLALNVDYLNTKLGVVGLMVKEGSVGALSVKLPWKGQGFEVEVDELELVLCLAASKIDEVSDMDSGSSIRKETEQYDCGEAWRGKEDVSGTSGDVHQGVKTIAKMVKWFLTSFHVKVKKMIVAFDPCVGKDEKKAESGRTLVLRVLEAECGTCESEDANSISDAGVHDFLGASRLTNFVKFQGAALELLQIDDTDDQTCSPGGLSSSFSEMFSGECLSNVPTSVITGEKGGFSGNLKLSIPWKNGSLDISNVHADVSIDPVELRLQPSTIAWFVHAWGACKNVQKHGRGNVLHKPMESVYFNSASHFLASSSIIDKSSPSQGSFSSTSARQDPTSAVVLPGSHFIHNWVPDSVKKQGQDHFQEELDLGASVDQFFECLDGLRNSQSALGSSGMWNWTCSVLSALTAESTLASGSLPIPSAQQQVQTKLKTTLAGITIMLFFDDERKEALHNLKDDRTCFGSNVHYIVAECKDIFVLLQVCPQDMKFDGSLRYIEVADYSCNENTMDIRMGEDGNVINSKTLVIQHLQDDVQIALPHFPVSNKDLDTEESNTSFVSDSQSRNVTKIILLSTSSATSFQLTVNSNSSDGSLTGPTLFSLQLPPFILWVNFWSISTILDLLKNIMKSVEFDCESNGFPSGKEKEGLSSGNTKNFLHSDGGTQSSKEKFLGSISLPTARVILCFPFGSSNDVGGCSSRDQFIAIDFSSPSTLEKRKEDTSALPDAASPKRYTSRGTSALTLNIGNMNFYLVNRTCEDDIGLSSSGLPRHIFDAHKIIYISNNAGCLSTVSLIWQEGLLTGPWIAEKAKSLATPEDSGSRKRFKVKGYEFASVTAVEDIEDVNSQTRGEMILSSSFFLHVHLFPIAVHLSSSQYSILHHLFDQTINALSVACNAAYAVEVSSVSQTTILIECESVEILIRPDAREDIKRSLQTELPGSWHSLKLRIRKFNMLSVLDIGGIKGANFFWLGHGEGKLWGSTTGVPGHEIVLISCSNSARKRGDGGGSNVLSSRLAGSAIAHFQDPVCLEDLTSITLTCDTIVAAGGRLDWLDVLSSFFILPSKLEKEGADGLSKENLSLAQKSSFILKLVDVGLSYEPYLRSTALQNLPSQPTSSHVKEETNESYFACLLAASSLSISNSTMEDSPNSDFKIRVQDLGFLLRPVDDNLGGTHNVGYLQDMGYVKVAQEALLEAILRTNCENGLLWEVVCSKAHIFIGTCHDTTYGLVRLAAQLQQLFAPDLEESAVHLQNRWNNIQQAQERDEFSDGSRGSNDSFSPSSQPHVSNLDRKSEVEVCGLMDEISEDAFHLDGNQACQFDANESQVHLLLDENLLGDSGSSIETADLLSDAISFEGSVPTVGLEPNQTSFLQSGSFPEFIESYCLSDLRSLSELSIGKKSSSETLKLRSGDFGGVGIGRGDSGWYGDASLSIDENHIPDMFGEPCMNQFLEAKLPSIDPQKSISSGNAMGRVLFENINVSWRMYSGSDWHSYGKIDKPSGNIQGRDTTGCLELALSGIQFHYDIFPIDGTCASKLALSVRDFNFYDKSKAAPWKLVLGYYNSKNRPRESSSKALKMDLEAVKPDPRIPLEEYRLHIAFLPMLLHLHQSQLDFLIRFFGSITSSTEPSLDLHSLGGAKPSSMKSSSIAGNAIADEALLPFFQKFDIWPVLLRVDYSPHHVDLAALRSGKYVELVNLVPWKGVELQLKHVHAVGVYGWSSVCEIIGGEWLEEVSHNQVHKILRGLPTIRSLVAVGAGAAKFVSLPMESYRKDQRIIKGMQRGTIAFLRSISLEAIGLGVHLAAGAHEILLQAEYMLSSIPPSVSQPRQRKSKPNVRYNQPKDAQQGIQQAYESLSDGLGKSASALVRTPLKKYERGASAGSALVTAVRAVPAAAIAPLSACAGAAHYTFLGFRNSLDPERKKESMEKYMGPMQPHEYDYSE